jgi:hypothetical protein
LVILVLTLVLEAIEAHLDRVRLRAFPQRHPEPGRRQGPAARR